MVLVFRVLSTCTGMKTSNVHIPSMSEVWHCMLSILLVAGTA